MDYERQRRLMVETQLVTRGIRDRRVLEAMRSVPRHLFVPEDQRHRAYDDNALPIGEGQTISQPYMVAIMTELLELQGDEKVLEVGTGSGYQAAVIGTLARRVFSIERIPELARQAELNLREAGITNVTLATADGTAGLPGEAPFDRIIVTAGAPEFPRPLLEQLADGGIAVGPVGSRFSQDLMKVGKSGGRLTESYHTPCIFVPLIGRFGWES